MKLFFIFTFSMCFSFSAFAKPILERSLFNSLNGESFKCVVHENGKIELFSDNSETPEKSKTVTLQPDIKKITQWIEETKSDSTYKKVTASSNKKGIEALTSEKTSQYVQRGVKEYFFIDGKQKIPFYKIKGFIPNSRENAKDMAGNLQFKMKNYQQLKGVTDLACKMAM